MAANFQSQARKARHPSASPAHRAHAFGCCVARFSSLTKQPFSEILNRLSKQFGYTDRRNATVEQIISSLDQLEIERNRFLQILAAFARHRITCKHRGRRVTRRADMDTLNFASQPEQKQI